jgi:hypothetical protein
LRHATESRGAYTGGRAETKRDGTRAETRIGLSAKRTSPFKSAGGSVQSTTSSRVVEKTSGYPLHSPLSPSLPLPCVTVCHQILRELYKRVTMRRRTKLLLRTIPVSQTAFL